MEQRIGVVAIVVSDKSAVSSVQTVLSAHCQVIAGRMGIPSHENEKNVIALIVKGSVEDISALTGALGRIAGVQAKSVLTANK
ncbi:MAG: CopG family transcriptional regulator [Clostridia bacterium]|nr:CopG family transcriptional regulator [Clostridia bacterium]